MFEGIMQPMHLLVILVIALLFFGPAKLGELGKGLGDGIRHFKNAMKEGSEPAAPAASAAPKEKPQEQK
jgi:sec-independent protein translocase protein TatA